MGQFKPPSTGSNLNASLFMIGKDSQGHWVVQDQRGVRGGLFVDRIAALRFALFENGHQPQAVIMVPGIFELNMNGSKSAVPPPAVPAASSLRQRAA